MFTQNYLFLWQAIHIKTFLALLSFSFASGMALSRYWPDLLADPEPNRVWRVTKPFCRPTR